MKGLVGGGTEAGSLEMTKLKSVMAGVRQRGQCDVVGFRGNKREFEIQVVKDSMVDGCELVKLKLRSLGLEPFDESDFIVMEIGSLKDIDVLLTLLCVCQWVVNVTGNGGLIIR